MRLFILSLLACFNFAHADTTHEVFPIADTYVTQEAEQRNFGKESLLDLKTYFAGTRLLLKFDPTQIQNILNNKDLVSARLELPIQNHYISRLGDIGLFKMNVDWTETGATWKCPNDTNTSNYNQDCSNPWLMWSHDPNNTIPYPYDRSPFSVGKIAPEQAVPVGFDVAEYIKNLSSSNNYGFAVFKITENINEPLAFYSRESDVGPKLIIVTKDKVPVNNKVVATITANLTTGTIPLAVNFDASQSKAKAGSSIEKMELDIGNGYVALDKNAPTLSYTFTAEGEYQAILKVTDVSGDIAYSAINISAMGSEQTAYDQNYGYWINIPQNQNIKYSSGQSALLNGDICKIWKTQGRDGSCQWVDKQKIQIRAFFPDMTTEVSSQLNVTTTNQRRSFAFQTPTLNKEKLNVLTLMVGEIDPTSVQFGALKSKIEMRIMVLDQKLTSYEAQGVDGEVLKILKNVRATLSSLAEKIDQRNAKVPTLLAQFNLPLQVDNKVSSEKYYSTMIGGLRYELSSASGNLYQGEKASIKSRVTNIDYRSNNYNQIEKYNLKYTYKNALVNVQNYPTFNKGESREYIYNDPNVSNLTDFYSFGVEVEEKYQWWSQKLGSTDFFVTVMEDNQIPYWTNTNSNVVYVNQLPSLTERAVDDFGKLNKGSFKAILSGQRNENITSKYVFTTTTNGTDYTVKANANEVFTEDGSYNISYEISDYQNNFSTPNPYLKHYVLDRKAPVIHLFNSDNLLTNNSNFTLSVTAFDENPGTTRVLHNGVVKHSTAETVFDCSVVLTEGLNTFEVESVDLAGNIAVKKGLYNIVLDTLPPVLGEVKPAIGANVYDLNFTISAKSNEPLSSVKINGVNATLSADGKIFSRSVTAYVEGQYPIQILATDKALNTTTLEYNTNVVLKVLDINLVSITPDADQPDKLIVVGAPGATRPGSQVRLYSGIFNQKSFTSSNVDGSFVAVMDFFNSIEVRAIDPVLNKTETGNLSYNVDTTLAGVVKDSDNKPLAGVKVTIISSGQQTMTDASGSFKIPTPATGDQVLSLDGTTVPLQVSGPNKKFARVSVAVSIGTRQSNVLDKPIYLAPLIYDGTETVIPDANTSVDVESPHAPGVVLRIPAGVATFPNALKAGAIGIAEINSTYTPVPVPEFAIPNTVYAFEPSGLKFSEPVELTLPNVNEIPPGVQMVILSKNSEKGIWEVDGLARVSDDGSEIVTEAGGGITHFSEIYAAPMGPRITEFAGASNPGADTSSGILKSSIELPTYKVMGKDISLGLNYQSNWADPSVIVSNVIDVPRNEYTISSSGGVRSIVVKASVEVSGKAWVEPEEIKAKFYTSNLSSNSMSFKGVPQKSVISYAMDLNSLPTGLHTYNSHYDIQLKEMLLGTKTTKIKKLWGATRTYQESFSETRILDELYPQDMGGALYVQNYKNSNAGQGWRINGVGRIYNVNEPRVLIEESNGETTSYAVNSNIETLYLNNNKTLGSVDLSDWENIKIYSNNDKQLINYNFQTSQTANNGYVSNYSGRFEGYSVWYSYSEGYNADTFTASCAVGCSIEYMSFVKEKNVSSIFKIDNNKTLLMTLDGGIEISENNNISKFSGKYFTPSSDYTWWYGGDPWPTSYCTSNLGVACYGEVKRQSWATPTASLNWGEACPYSNSQAAIRNYCKANGAVAQSFGEVGVQGFQDGQSPAFNNITDAIKGNSDEIFLADSGNNRVRAFNVSSKSARTIAGNGQTSDVGDGNLAINASFYHPRGLAKDSLGNLYISTENGFIRKVDPNGYISTFAGKSNGVLSNKSQAQDMRLNNPYGMVVDTTNNYLYVADTGHHRVVRIDLVTREAMTVAGTGSCISGNIGDGKAALLSSLCSPTSLGLDDQKNLLIFDKGHNRIRRVNFESATNGNIQYQSIAADNSTLVKQNDGTFIRTFRNGNFFKYDSAGKQILSQDRVGNKFTYTYGSDGKLESIKDPTNRSIVFNYSWDNLVSIEDPTGRITNFYYDGDNLTSVRFPDNSERSFEYSSSGLMINESDKSGNLTSYLYSQWKRLDKVVRADNSFISFVDGVSSTIGNTFISGQSGALKSAGRNEIVDGIKDPKGNITSLNKDEKGYVTKLTDSNGDFFTIERDLDGRPIKITRPDETIVTMTYDSTFHDLIRKTDSLTDSELEFTYDQWGNLTNEVIENGEEIKYNYHPSTGLLLSKILPLNTVESYEYFSNGLLSAKINPLGQRTSYVYGINGNLVTLTDNMGQVTQVVRDLSGNIISSTNAKGQTVNYSYDEYNHLSSVKSALNNLTSYEYSASGQLAKVIDPENNQTFFEYDVLGRLIKKTDPMGYSTQLAYDSNDNLVKEIDPNGNVKTFEYDNLNRLTKRILPDNIYQLTYDDRDNVKSIKNFNSEVSFDYLHFDNNDVVIKEVTKGLGDLSGLPAAVVTYGYDESGNRISMGTSEGEFIYNYDKLNRLTKITNHKNEVFDFSYDQGSRLVGQRSPASLTEYNYDNVNFLTGIVHKKRSNQVAIAQLNYERDAIGNITKQSTMRGDHNFSYDGNNQLINATHPEAITSVFTYDSLGNRVTDQDGNYAYESKKQRLISDWRFTYLYDNNGNLLSKTQKSDTSKITNYEYSSENQLLAIKEFNGTSLIRESYYNYDALGRRVLKEYANHSDSSQSFSKKFIYDGQSILFEMNGDNELLATYTHSLNRIDDVLAMDRNGISYFYLKDHLGTINEILNSSGNVIQRYVYSSFGSILKMEDGNGQAITSPIVENFYTFTGRESDFESGLNYYRARYYDSSIGRFISADPDMGRAKKPITFNSKYIYGNNSPILNIDPQGRLAFLVVIAIAAVIGGTMSAIQSPGGWSWGAFFSGAAIGAAAGAMGWGIGGLIGPMFGGTFGGTVAAGATSGVLTNIAVSSILGKSITAGGLLLSGFLGGLAAGISYSNSQSASGATMKDVTEGTKVFNDEIILNLELGPAQPAQQQQHDIKFNMDKFLH